MTSRSATIAPAIPDTPFRFPEDFRSFGDTSAFRYRKRGRPCRTSSSPQSTRAPHPAAASSSTRTAPSSPSTSASTARSSPSRAGWSTTPPRSGRRCRPWSPGAIAKAGLRADQLSALGITNQRETTVLWDRATGKPVHNAIVWQDTRTSALCNELGGSDGQDRFRDAYRAAAGELLLRAEGGLAAGQRARAAGRAPSAARSPSAPSTPG